MGSQEVKPSPFVFLKTFDGAPLRCDVDEVPGAPFLLRSGAAIEQDRQIAGAEVGDALAMGVAMEKESDPGEPLEQFLQGLSAQQAFALRFIAKEGKVVDEDHVVVVGDLFERPFELLFEVERKIAVGREQGGCKRSIQGD